MERKIIKTIKPNGHILFKVNPSIKRYSREYFINKFEILLNKYIDESPREHVSLKDPKYGLYKCREIYFQVLLNKFTILLDPDICHGETLIKDDKLSAKIKKYVKEILTMDFRTFTSKKEIAVANKVLLELIEHLKEPRENKIKYKFRTPALFPSEKWVKDFGFYLKCQWRLVRGKQIHFEIDPDDELDSPEDFIKFFECLYYRHIDEMPEKRVNLADPKYYLYKCRVAFIGGFRFAVDLLKNSNVIKDEKLRNRINNFLRYKFDGSRFTTKEEINMVNNLLLELIEYLKGIY